MYEYRATIIKIVDGDTVDVDIDLGFNVVLRDERVRIAGIDTPESRTRDLEEKEVWIGSQSKSKTTAWQNLCAKNTNKQKRRRYERQVWTYLR